MKALRVPAIAALAGAILLVVLFPRTDPSAAFPAALDRDAAIQRARQFTSKFGIDTASWKVAATILTDEKLSFYLRSFPNDPAARLFTPVAWGIVFTDPGATRTVRMRLSTNGGPLEWESKQTGGQSASGAAVTPEIVLQDFAGASVAGFKSVDAPVPGDLHWSFPMVAKLVVSQRNGRVVSALLSPAYAQGFTYRTGGAARAIGFGLSGFARFVAFCIAFVLAVRACVGGRLSWRVPAGLVAAMVLWAAWLTWAGSDYQAMVWGQSRGLQVQLDENDRRAPSGSGFSSGQQTGAEIGFRIATLMGFLGPACFPFLSAFAFGGAGFVRGHGRLRQKWDSLELLLTGQIFTRQVSLPIAAGALCGIAVAAVPLLVAQVFRGATLRFHDMSVLAAPLSLVGLLRLSVGFFALSFLGFGLPVAAGVRRRWLRIASLVLLAAVYLFSVGDGFNWLLPSLLTAAIAGAAYFMLYRQYDILAAASAMISASAVAAPCILLSQPTLSFRESGLRLLVLLIAALAAFAHFAVRGREIETTSEEELAESEITPIDGPSLSNRKRLEAEFQVARKAQQDALPSAPPVIEGYSFSASCDPALQVGGDLYDLFHLPDGRLGVAVADVSGKGVPAALYMMVTKGLLTATAQDSSDLAYILQQINFHLQRACKKKVFVTMAAIVMDPARRRIEYGRAGHNPIVWRRVSRGETSLRKPQGLGLGMFSADKFARSLQLEELELEPGDALVLYSDGVTEAINGTMDQFGEERLMQSVERADGQSAEETRAAILRDLADFTAGTPSRDDVTVVVLRVDANLTKNPVEWRTSLG